MKKNTTFFLILFCIAMILTTGCTNNSESSKAPVMVSTTEIPLTTPMQTTQISPTITKEPTKVVPTNTPDINSQVTLIQNDNPSMDNLKFTKNYFPNKIDNCPMQEAFPTIAKDPAYGLLQTPPKIAAISAGEYRTFLRDYTEGAADKTKMIGVARCINVPANPWWNFVEVSARITPTNARPANYTVSLNVRSFGKIIAQFKTTEQLTYGNTIEFVSYIPLKTDEMDAFDSIKISYDKIQN
jgi:hypothetical protein